MLTCPVELSFRFLILTLPDFFQGETDIANRLFADGLQRLHLRKPEATKVQTAEWIEQIEPQYRSRIVVHDHHDLACRYGLGGIHLNSRNTEVPEWFSRKDFTLSRSCHTIEETERYHPTFDYLFLSPIFDSISKQGYKAAFPREELADAKARGLLDNVFALGGVTFGNLREVVEDMGFAGGAIMGGFWNEPVPLPTLA